MVETHTIVALSAASAAALLAGYLVYFDYKRRNDSKFRKRLRKEKKKVAKATKSDNEASTAPVGISPAEISRDSLKEMVALANAETIPTHPSEREKYFMDLVKTGEETLVRGPEFELPAAFLFYRALRSYPSPVGVIMLFQQTLPPQVFGLVMEMVNLDVKQRAEGYYDVFPPKSMNVKIANLPMKDKFGKPLENDGVPVLRSALVATKDIEEGEVIYKENSVVATLDLDLQASQTHCTHCFRETDTLSAIPDDPLEATYCSSTCRASSKHSQGILFGLEPPIPAAIGDEEENKPKTEEELQARRRAQQDFVELLRTTGVTRPLLIARFIGCMVTEQSAKLGAGVPNSSLPKSSTGMFGVPEPEGDSDAYSFYDHIERLRFLEILETPAEVAETEALKKVLQTAMQGLEEFVGDRYALLKGKMAYNSIGVCFDEGRNDKPVVTVRPEDIERTRTPHGTSRQTGSAFYRVSSYLSHSCAPNTRPSFSAGTTELHLVANKAIPIGTELTMAYVDVNQGPNETRLEARRRRRQELARGWRFACECEKCLQELDEGILKEGEGKSADEELNLGEGAKLEAAVQNFDKN